MGDQNYINTSKQENQLKIVKKLFIIIIYIANRKRV